MVAAVEQELTVEGMVVVGNPEKEPLRVRVPPLLGTEVMTLITSLLGKVTLHGIP